jgi:hypothetical protein
MSFQAYLDTIKEKTGKTPDDFRALAEQKGLLGDGVPAGPIIAWLAEDFGLGRGHAMALVATFRSDSGPRANRDDRIQKHFAGGKAVWRATYDGLLSTVSAFGPDVSVQPADSYLSLLRGTKKFAVVAITAKRMDVGLKLKGVAPTPRLAPSGTWNAMVTHRVQLTAPEHLDPELTAWLRDAYDRA